MYKRRFFLEEKMLNYTHHDHLEIDFNENCNLCVGKDKCGFLNKKTLQGLEKNSENKQKALFLIGQFVERCPCVQTV